MSLRHLIKDLKSLGIYDDICISMDSNFEESYGYYYMRDIEDTYGYYIERYYMINMRYRGGVYHLPGKEHRRHNQPCIIAYNKHERVYSISFAHHGIKLHFTFSNSVIYIFHNGAPLHTHKKYPSRIKDVYINNMEELIYICKVHLHNILMRHYAVVYRKTYIDEDHKRKCKESEHNKDMEFLRKIVG